MSDADLYNSALRGGGRQACGAAKVDLVPWYRLCIATRCAVYATRIREPQAAAGHWLCGRRIAQARCFRPAWVSRLTDMRLQNNACI